MSSKVPYRENIYQEKRPTTAAIFIYSYICQKNSATIIDRLMALNVTLTNHLGAL